MTTDGGTVRLCCPGTFRLASVQLSGAGDRPDPALAAAHRPRCRCGDRRRGRRRVLDDRRPDGQPCADTRDRGEATSDPPGKVLMAIFDETVEEEPRPADLHYPLSRRGFAPLPKERPRTRRLSTASSFTSAGRRSPNAFSELNDPVDQRGRFQMQLKREGGAAI
ncbi:MAG: hypothetical protein MZV70_48665 [Desulfobacterales bacterium]|nr:hypothetical protein [Desulfobacterales bacterium]